MAMGMEGAGPNTDLLAVLRQIDTALQREEQAHEDHVDRLHKLQRDLDEAGIRLDAIRCAVQDMITSVETGHPDGRIFPPHPEAALMQCHENPDGSATFCIKGGKSFSLSTRLAQLFQFLASGPKESSDKRALVRWKSKVEISAYMEKRAGKPISRSYVSYMVLRLRRVLDNSKYDPGLIQMHRRHGYRLALLHGGIRNSPQTPQ